MQQLDLFAAPEKKSSSAIKAEKQNLHAEPPAVQEKTDETAVEKSIPKNNSASKKNAQQAIEKIRSKRGRKSYKEMDEEMEEPEIPADEILYQKQYYSITEVAEWFRVNSSLLRFWENEFDILKPRKNKKGDRLFRPEDVKNLQLIYHLLRRRKYSIEGAKQYLKDNKKNADINMMLIESLTKFRAFLLELKANLDA